MATAATRRQPQQADVDRSAELRVPGGVGLVEGVAVDPPVQAVGEERPQMQQHDRSGEDPQQRERSHADQATEQLVEARHERRGHLIPSRTSGAPQDPGRGGSALCQEVTLASR